MSPALKLLRELIALPSVNPAFLPPGDPHAGEALVADFLAAVSAQAGLEVEFQPVAAGRSNLLVRLSPHGKPRARVLLAPHLDTVGGLNLPGNLFTPRIVGGKLYGRGACDTKGSVAAMLTALSKLAASRQRPTQTEIVFAGLVDEECHQLGSRYLAASGFRADLAIVGEPTRLRLVTTHKGVMWLELKTLGKAAHGARPELGRNAVHVMARIVDLLLTRYAEDLAKRRHPLLGQPTISVGSIRGGSQPNIVPSECHCRIDRRLVPGESPARVLREMKSLFRNHGLKAGFRSLQTAPCPPLETSSSHPLVGQFLGVIGQQELAGVDYFSDAGILSNGGIPSIVFGPGDIAQAHTPDEWIALNQLEQGQELLLRFLRSLP